MSFNLTPQSSSAFQNDIINQIIAVLNSLDQTGVTDSDFLTQAQSILFAGTFLPGPSNNMMVMNPANTSNTTWQLGGGNTTTAPMINLQSNTFQGQTGSFTNVNATTVSCQNANVQAVTAASGTLNGSPILTQATMPNIPPAVTSSFTNVSSGITNFSGEIGVIQFGFTITMDIDIEVTTSFTGTVPIMSPTQGGTGFANLCNRLRAGGMQTAATTLDQWIAGSNGNTDVRAVLEVTQTGMTIRGVTGGLNVGDQFNVMVTWAVDNFN